MIRSEEEGREEREALLLDDVFTRGGTTGAEFETGTTVGASPEELGWLEGGTLPTGERASSA